MNIIVIGGGPGGYVAAIRAAQLGGSVTLIEKNSIGGTCLNRGCMPTKALLHSAELFTQAKAGESCGVTYQGVSLDWGRVQENRAAVVKRLTGGVSALIRANRIKLVTGEAKFVDAKTVSVDGQMYEADRIIIAAGSSPVFPPVPGIEDCEGCITSTQCLELDHVPESLAVIGGGVIGVELGYAYACFGSKVTIIEKDDKLLPGMDAELVSMLTLQLKQKGIDILTGCEAASMRDENGCVQVRIVHEGVESTVESEKVLICVGRKPCLSSLELDNAGIKVESGCIACDEAMQTSVDGIYAVGDCTGKAMLAHAAMAMGEIAAENIFGAGKTFRRELAPSCCYVGPEFAGIGMTESDAVSAGYNIRVGRFPTAANGRSLVAGSTDGMVKVILGADYGELLGVHILAPNATELIEQAGLAMRFELSADDFISNVVCHPTVSEAVREAFMAADKKAIHNIN